MSATTRLECGGTTPLSSLGGDASPPTRNQAADASAHSKIATDRTQPHGLFCRFQHEVLGDIRDQRG